MSELADSPFLKACRGEPVPHTPVWLMRQAGRYQRFYREIRARMGFLELCHRPDVAAEVTVRAATELGTDAAILFADILLVLEPLGLRLEFLKGEGPLIHDPIREPRDLDRLAKEPDPGALGYVYEAVRLARRDLDARVPLLGFAGAPFTLASYMIEGGPSRDYAFTKRFMWSWPDAWRELLARIARFVGVYLSRQVAAGVQAVQLFDTWAGCLTEADYRAHVLPASRTAIAGVSPAVPVIHFGLVGRELLPAFREAGATMVGVDARTPLDQARATLGRDVPVQGNLDPAVLFLDRAGIERHVKDVLARAGDRGHVFNLGHGILKETPEENAKLLVDLVHEHSRR